MNPKPWLALMLVSLVAGCGGSAQPSGDTSKAQSTAAAQKPPEHKPTVFDPWVGTIDRAKGVQNTVDEQAVEQRRKIDEATR